MNLRKVLSLACLLAVCTAAHGQNLVYFEENGGGGNPRGLYDLNAGTGAATLRSTVGGIERFFGMAVQPGTGVVFAVSVPGNTLLWTLNLNTGVATLVGATGVDTIADITFHPTTGKLYGIQRNIPYGFYEIDPATAGVAFLGNLNDSVRCGLTFGPNGTLYGFTTTGILSTVNLATLATTLVGGTPGSLVEDATATASGDLYFTTFPGEVFKINPANGARTLVHLTGMSIGLLGLIVDPGAGCYPDCNGDGALNLADFGCFQTKFALNDPYADCNGDGVLNLADFGCFQTKFALGCP